MKYSFILEIDDISKDDINELVNILSDNKIKFHVLKSDKELKENPKHKEVINKAINYIETHKRKDEFLELNEWGTRDLLDMLNEVEDK